MSRNALLKLAVPLVQTHGFTRQALARSVLSLPTPHTQPLSETAVSSLFGDGDEARRTFIDAWLDETCERMKTAPSRAVGDVLAFRLRQNEPVLSYLPEAFALLASPSSGLPPLDPLPALKHAAKVADEACFIAGDVSVGNAWYARRASLATVYAAAELHQLTSRRTAYQFLDRLLNTSLKVESTVGDIGLFAQYVGRSWAGILTSRGIL